VLTFFQGIVLGLLQGVTELFPVSSLGHSVILPQLLGWTDVVAAQSLGRRAADALERSGLAAS
jgi:undecaprenyl-diphosphatase